MYIYLKNISQNFLNINYEHIPAKDQMENIHVLVSEFYFCEFIRMS